MDILVISYEYYPRIGGISTVAREVAEGLATNGHRCTVLTTGVDGSPATEVHNKVTVARVNRLFYSLLYGLSPFLFVYMLKNRDRLKRYDIIHIHAYHTLFSLESMLLCRLLKKSDCRIVFSPHYHAIGHTAFRNLLHKVYKPFGKYLFTLSDAVVCVSGYEAQLVRDNFSMADGKVSVIPNGTPKRAIARVNNEQLSLLYVGHLREYKGLKYVLYAVRNIVDRYDLRPVLNVVGKGEDENAFRALAKKLHIEDRVTWNSHLTDAELNRKYAEASVFLLLSRAEAYGIVVAEALRAGIPCIVANTSALKEFASEPGCFGVDLPPDIEALADLIVRIFRNPPRVGPLSRKIRYWEEIVGDYDRLFHDLTGAVMSSPAPLVNKVRK